MAKSSDASQLNAGYSTPIGFVYVFNLMMGSGVLALPKAFAQTGVILGLIALGILGLVSYCTTTFMIEAMAITNAIKRHRWQKVEGVAVVNSAREGLELSIDVSNNYTKKNKNSDEPDSIVENSSEPVVFANTNVDDVMVDDSHSNETREKQCDVEDTTFANDRVIEDSRESEYPEPKILEMAEENGSAHKKPEVANGVIDGCSPQKVANPESQLDQESLYEITVKVEMGEMAEMLFHKVGVIAYYIAISLHLYGGLSIYTTAISKSVTTVVCGDPDCFSNGSVHLPCHNLKQFSVLSMYRMVLVAFVVTVCPFVFFTVSKTKFLQIFTMAFRWSAISTMIILAAIRMSRGHLNTETPLFHFKYLPNFFGVAVYAFMCQYSIPVILTPVTEKKRLKLIVFIDFICIFLFYCLLLLTAVFAFHEDKIQDIYSLNFAHPLFFRYVLELFPVFTLSTNFPILAIVLRENLKNLCLKKSGRDNGLFLRRILFPLLVITPPICIAVNTTDVGMLVDYTGTYSGAIIQYMIPSMLVYHGRKKMIKLVGVYENKYHSPFHHIFWVYLVVIWYVVCIVFVTYNKIKSA